MEVYQVTNEIERAKMVEQAMEDGADVALTAAVFKVGAEFCGIYAIEDANDFVFLENSGGLFVPENRYELIESIRA